MHLTPVDLVSRRRFVRGSLAFAAGAQLQAAARALGLSAAAPVCRLNAEQEVGPFYVPGELVRSDIREGKPGMPLTLRLVVLDARDCRPLPHAAVDVWHCDALGVYSGYTKSAGGPPGGGPGGGPGAGPPESGPPGDDLGPGDFPADAPDDGPGGPPPAPKPTDALTFLRGIQYTDARGTATFHTIFPGFYPGRVNHVHFKVHTGQAEGRAQPGSGHTAHVGQVFFPEEAAALLMQQAPYSRHHIHRTTQAEDGVFRSQGGSEAVCVLRPASGDARSGMHAELIAAVDPGADPAPAQRGRPL